MADIAELARQAVTGQAAASRFFDALRGGCTSQHLLFGQLQAMFSAGEPERARAFCRCIQKELERNL